MNLVDSSGWIEYFTDGKHAEQFSKPIERQNKLIIPTLIIYEVFKYLAREAGESQAWQAIAAMHSGAVISLGDDIALLAAQLSLEFKLPMADSIIYATAKANNATLWTQDADFKGMFKVCYISPK